MMKGQFSFLINYLKKEHIQIDYEEFIFQVQTHPDFPSLYAFSDTLRFFNIENLVARVEKENLDDLPDRFIALLNQEGVSLSLVEKYGNKYNFTINNKEQSVHREVFLKVWQGVVLLVEKNENIISSQTKPKQSILPVFLLVALISWGILSSIDVGFLTIALVIL